MDASIAYTLVSIAAVMYIGERIGRLVDEHVANTIKRQRKALRNLQKEAADRISIDFELWWEEEAKPAVRTAVLRQIEPQIPSHIPKEARDAALAHLPIDMMMGDIKQSVRECAVDLNLRNEEDALIKKMSSIGGLRKSAIEEIAEYRQNLEAQQQSLVEMGIDPEALVKRFGQPQE